MSYEEKKQYFDMIGKLPTNELYEALNCMPDELKENRFLANYAISIDPKTIEFFSDAIKDDESIAMIAIKKDGLLLKYFSDNIKANKKMVTFAIIQNGLAIMYADDSLKNDEMICLLAIANHENAIAYIDENILETLYVPEEERPFIEYAKLVARQRLMQMNFPEELLEDEIIGSFNQPFNDYIIETEIGLTEEEILSKRFAIIKEAYEKKERFLNWYDYMQIDQKTDINR